jgi:hypothetical protein
MRHEIARNTIVGIEEQDFHGNSQERQTLTENANQQMELSVAVNNEDRPMPFCYRRVYQDVSQTDLRIVWPREANARAGQRCSRTSLRIRELRWTALRVIARTVEADWDHSTAGAADTAAADMAVDWDCNSAAAADTAVDWDCNSAAAVADTAADWDCNSVAVADMAVDWDCNSVAAEDMAADWNSSWDP